jgi:multidrug resistance efflux pump
VNTGDVLATADTADAAAQLAVAQANLATAQARLAEDKAGATSAAKAQASAQVTQAEQQVTQAKQNQTYAKQQNDLAVKQGQAAVDRAKAQLAADKAAGAPANVLAQDQAAITSASDALASTKLRVAQSNAQAANSVKSAQLSLAGAKTSYAAQTAPATDAQLASDQAAVLTAESAVRASQATLDGAVLRAPVDGLVVAVDVEPGMTAPSGYAIQVQAMSMEVVASFAEADLPSLAVGQPATVTLTATDKTADGKVTRITPVASASSGGSGGVVTYEVAVAITQVPDGTLAGMTADIGVTTAEADGVVAVPAIALTGSAGNYAVRVVDSSGATETRSVEVGLTSSSLAEIRSGVQAGETVVIGTTSTRNTTTTTLGGGGGIAIPGGGFPGGGFRP